MPTGPAPRSSGTAKEAARARALAQDRARAPGPPLLQFLQILELAAQVYINELLIPYSYLLLIPPTHTLTQWSETLSFNKLEKFTSQT